MEITERLNSLKSYLAFLAHSYSSGDLAFKDDLQQEAMIAVWTALEKAQESGREVNDSYLIQKAKWVMLDQLKAASRREQPSPHDDTDLFDRPVYDSYGASRHADEIRSAVAELPERQREYVYLRFWRGWNGTSELRGSGYNPKLWYDSRRGAKRTLREKLAHLSTAV